jgi:hypothetical protein
MLPTSVVTTRINLRCSDYQCHPRVTPRAFSPAAAFDTLMFLTLAMLWLQTLPTNGGTVVGLWPA